MTNLEKRILSYSKESNFERLKGLIAKIPTYFIYDFKFTVFLLRIILSITSRFSKYDAIWLTHYYRKTNPGFTRDGYLRNPSDALMRSIYSEYHRYIHI